MTMLTDSQKIRAIAEEVARKIAKQEATEVEERVAGYVLPYMRMTEKNNGKINFLSRLFGNRKKEKKV